ncbi:hypothetical protein KAT80_02045 [Candidatus Pacearchaeota archaeon]|nr:hypothetical protein [Candidatus Pacearchaeota archaeon]
MPKEVNESKQEDKEKEKQDDSELEELIEKPEQNETAPEGVPSDEADEGKESNIDQNQFREFLQTESTAPVLEEITGEQELGGRVFFTPGMDTDVQDEDNAFRYDIQAKEDEPKYHGDYSTARQNLEEIDTAKIGRDIGQPQVREAGFVHAVEQTDSPMQEKYQEAQKIDMEKVGRENLFETRVKEVERKKLDYVIK